jgi:hypothetical protein
MAAADFPLTLSVDYPEDANRLTTAFRWLVAIPVFIVSLLITGSNSGIPILAPLVMILFHQKYSRWLFEWNQMLTRLNTRVGTYLLLLRHEYPSTDGKTSSPSGLPLPVRAERSKPLDAACEVDSCNPALRRVGSTCHRCAHRSGNRLVCNPDHRKDAGRVVQLDSRRHPVRHRDRVIRVHDDNRHVPEFFDQRVNAKGPRDAQRGHDPDLFLATTARRQQTHR